MSMGRHKGGALGPGRPKATPESRKSHGKTTMSFSISELKVLNRLLRSPWWRKQARDAGVCKCAKKEAKCQQVHHLFRYLASGSLDHLLVEIRGELIDISRQLASPMASAQIPKLSERLTHVAGKLPVEVLGYDPSDDVDFSVQKSLRAELKELRRVESMDDAELDLMEAQLSEQQRQLSLLQQQRAAQPQAQPQPQPQAVAGAGAVVHPQAQARATAQAQGNQQRPAPAQPLSNTGPRPFTAPFWPRNELQGGVPAALPPPQHTLSVGLIPLPAPALQGPAQGVTGPPPGPPLARVPAQQVPLGGLVAAAGLAGAALAPVLPVPESSLQPAALQGCAVDQYGQYRQYGQYGQEPLGLSTALPPCGRDGPQSGQTWAERVQVGIQPGLALRDQVGVRGCGVGT